MDAIKELEREQLRTDVPEIAPGDTVQRLGQGGRGQPGADPGLRGDRHAHARWRPQQVDHRASHRSAASAWSAPSWCTRRGSRRSRSCDMGLLVGPSSTSCAIASASPRRSASAAPADCAGGRPAVVRASISRRRAPPAAARRTVSSRARAAVGRLLADRRHRRGRARLPRRTGRRGRRHPSAPARACAASVTARWCRDSAASSSTS